MIPSDTKTVYEVFQTSAAIYGARALLNVLPATAEVYGIEPGEITFAEALDTVDEWATRLADAGYGQGMRVALLLENRPEFFLIWLALNKLGCFLLRDILGGEITSDDTGRVIIPLRPGNLAHPTQ